MELIIFFAAIIFWVLYYIFEGLHDTAFLKERDIIKDKLDDETYTSIDSKVKHFEKRWHLFDNLEKSLVKVVLSILIYLITNNLLFSFQLLCLALVVRVIVHDLVVAVGLGKGINHIGPSEDVMWDTFLRKTRNFGINQYVIKAVPLIIVIWWIISSL